MPCYNMSNRVYKFILCGACKLPYFETSAPSLSFRERCFPKLCLCTPILREAVPPFTRAEEHHDCDETPSCWNCEQESPLRYLVLGWRCWACEGDTDNMTTFSPWPFPTRLCGNCEKPRGSEDMPVWKIQTRFRHWTWIDDGDYLKEHCEVVNIGIEH